MKFCTNKVNMKIVVLFHFCSFMKFSLLSKNFMKFSVINLLLSFCKKCSWTKQPAQCYDVNLVQNFDSLEIKFSQGTCLLMLGHIKTFSFERSKKGVAELTKFDSLEMKFSWDFSYYPSRKC